MPLTISSLKPPPGGGHSGLCLWGTLKGVISQGHFTAHIPCLTRLLLRGRVLGGKRFVACSAEEKSQTNKEVGTGRDSCIRAGAAGQGGSPAWAKGLQKAVPGLGQPPPVPTAGTLCTGTPALVPSPRAVVSLQGAPSRGREAWRVLLSNSTPGAKSPKGEGGAAHEAQGWSWCLSLGPAGDGRPQGCSSSITQLPWATAPAQGTVPMHTDVFHESLR